MASKTTEQSGWPMVTCSRCGGSGKYSYNQIDGDRCYGCNGKGIALASSKVRQIASEYIQACKSARQPLAQQVEVAMRSR